MMRTTFPILVASLLAFTASPAIAATKSKPAAKPAASAPAARPAAGQGGDKVENAMLYLKVLISALQSEKVEQPVKAALVRCLYENPLSKISDSVDTVIAENPGKINRDNPSELLAVMARICGYNPEPAAATGR